MSQDQVAPFGYLPAGQAVQAVTIAGGGLTARVVTFGARLQSLVPDGHGRSLVLGAHTVDPYLSKMRSFGAIVGPVANRIADGRMTIAGRTCNLDRNEGGITTLHGGAEGFWQRLWRIEAIRPDAVTLSIHHPDGLCGFPGPIDAQVHYALEDDGVLSIDITGTADATAAFAPCFHGYWNLDGRPDISAHLLTVHAARYLPVDDRIFPGDPANVVGTPFDYRHPAPPSPSLDHNFCIADARGPLRPACRLEAGGFALEVATTDPGLQVHAGDRIDTAPFHGLEGVPYTPNAGIAFEPQFWPDAVNRDGWASPVIGPGEQARQYSRYALART